MSVEEGSVAFAAGQAAAEAGHAAEQAEEATETAELAEQIAEGALDAADRAQVSAWNAQEEVASLRGFVEEGFAAIADRLAELNKPAEQGETAPAPEPTTPAEPAAEEKSDGEKDDKPSKRSYGASWAFGKD